MGADGDGVWVIHDPSALIAAPNAGDQYRPTEQSLAAERAALATELRVRNEGDRLAEIVELLRALGVRGDVVDRWDSLAQGVVRPGTAMVARPRYDGDDAAIPVSEGVGVVVSDGPPYLVVVAPGGQLRGVLEEARPGLLARAEELGMPLVYGSVGAGQPIGRTQLRELPTSMDTVAAMVGLVALEHLPADLATWAMQRAAIDAVGRQYRGSFLVGARVEDRAGEQCLVLTVTDQAGEWTTEFVIFDSRCEIRN